MKNSSDVKNDTHDQPMASKDSKHEVPVEEVRGITLNLLDEVTRGETSDEGWQEAVPKGRFPGARKSSVSRRPNLTKINTNVLGDGENVRYRGKPASGFYSPKATLNDVAAGAATVPGPISKKMMKSSSFSPKVIPSNSAENSASAKSAPNSPAIFSASAKSVPSTSPVAGQSIRKAWSYKEVAVAPPGTIVKVTGQDLLKEKGSSEHNAEVSKVAATLKPTIGEPTEEGKDGNMIKEKKDLAYPSAESKIKVAQKGDSETTVATTSELLLELEKPSGTKKAAEIPETADLQSEKINSAINPEGSPSDMEIPDIAEKINLETINSTEKESECEPVSPACEETSVEGTQTALEKVTQVGDDPLCRPSVGGDAGDGKQDETITVVKEPGSKLSAAAPPFNPSPVPVFGSVAMSVFNEQGGILPPPVNVPPMLPIIPIRKHPHQSATARIPYGPRLAGGYSRSGTRGPRVKPGLQNGETITVDASCLNPGIMNPNAAVFVPGQPWLLNGFPVSPNNYPTSPNEIPPSPQSFPSSPGSLAASPGSPSEVTETIEACEEENYVDNISMEDEHNQFVKLEQSVDGEDVNVEKKNTISTSATPDGSAQALHPEEENGSGIICSEEQGNVQIEPSVDGKNAEADKKKTESVEAMLDSSVAEAHVTENVTGEDCVDDENQNFQLEQSVVREVDVEKSSKPSTDSIPGSSILAEVPQPEIPAEKASSEEENRHVLLEESEVDEAVDVGKSNSIYLDNTSNAPLVAEAPVSEIVLEKTGLEEKCQTVQLAKTVVHMDVDVEGKKTACDAPEGPAVEEFPEAAVINEKSVKCWADYSDDEPEVVEILS